MDGWPPAAAAVLPLCEGAFWTETNMKTLGRASFARSCCNPRVLQKLCVSVPALLHKLPSYTQLLDEPHALRPTALHLDVDALYSVTLGHRLDVCTRKLPRQGQTTIE